MIPLVLLGAAGDSLSGSAGAVTIANVTYPSTLDAAVTAIEARVGYAAGFHNRPLMLLMHGLHGTRTSFADSTFTRFAELGFFVVASSLRGQGGSDGTDDLGGRNVHDIIDAAEYVRAHATYGPMVSSRTVVVGYSNGGCNTLQTIARCPDLAATYVDHFGISSYASWYDEVDAGTQAEIAGWVGGNPATVPDAYAARDPLPAMAVQLATAGPFLYMFHDEQDAVVDVHHTQDVVTALTAAGLTARFSASYSNSGDAADDRYTHGYPAAVEGLLRAEPLWTPRAIGARAWVMPLSGTIRVLGWFRSLTRDFEIWLGDTETGPTPKASTTNDHAATVTYDLAAHTFLVTPLTGTVSVQIIDGARTVTDTISTATELTAV